MYYYGITKNAIDDHFYILDLSFFKKLNSFTSANSLKKKYS